MVKCKKSVPKALIEGDCLGIRKSTTFSGKHNAFWPFRGLHSVIGRVAEMVKCKKSVPKALMKEGLPLAARTDHFQ